MKHWTLFASEESRSHKCSFQTADISLIFPSFHILCCLQSHDAGFFPFSFGSLSLPIFFNLCAGLHRGIISVRCVLARWCIALFVAVFFFLSSCGSFSYWVVCVLFFVLLSFSSHFFFCISHSHQISIAFVHIKRIVYASMSVMIKCIRYEVTISVMVCPFSCI